ncbi:MAG: hypothetical protein LBB55_01470 [Zoogloeaceae bacterium]|jgi:hypothetical protein|nr:hypothetical protein [Zoogloeaceae bacterium]
MDVEKKGRGGYLTLVTVGLGCFVGFRGFGFRRLDKPKAQSDNSFIIRREAPQFRFGLNESARGVIQTMPYGYTPRVGATGLFRLAPCDSFKSTSRHVDLVLLKRDQIGGVKNVGVIKPWPLIGSD